jgi:hypothetical protein
MSRVTPIAGVLVIAACAAPSPRAPQASATPTSPMEGTFEYVGRLRGQSILIGGHYVFLYGPADGGAPMTSDAGTYRISRDTATHTITYSTNPQRIGLTFLWTPESWSGDTVTYVVMNAERRVTGRGQSVKRR